MKPLLRGFLIFISSISLMQAADKPASAFATIKQARHLLGDTAGAHLLSMESEHAQLHPRYWWIRFYDDNLFLKVRAVQMIGPDMVRNIEPANPFQGGDRDYVIEPDQLKYDSDRCIAFMERAAKESHIPLHSLNMRLEKPHPGESSPIWQFEWLDEKGKTLGKISVSATTGRVTEIVGLKIKSEKFQNVSRKTVSQNVEDTFLGIGADLEEFFTGKRTVDQSESGSEGKSGSEK